MPLFKFDLHLHTVLSPCAGMLMTPVNILEQACKQGIDLLAITDHNTARNVEVTVKLGNEYGIRVIPGMEVETAEGVHILCLFEEITAVLDLQEVVYRALPDRENDEEFFGYQLVSDIRGNFIDREWRLLAAATSLSLESLVKLVGRLGGQVIPSHICRENGLITNLGFVPENLSLPVMEIAANRNRQELITSFPYLEKYILIKNSDAHFPDEIKAWNQLSLPRLGLTEIMNGISSGR
ncbi:MAG: PHP domain-containing protein [Bacillota bacterium]